MRLPKKRKTTNDTNGTKKREEKNEIAEQKFVFFVWLGRVEPSSHPPGTPTDPDVPNFRTSGPRHPAPLEKDSLSNMSE
jgi:hypothetical protein